MYKRQFQHSFQAALESNALGPVKDPLPHFEDEWEPRENLYTREMVAEFRMESEMAKDIGQRWQDRGPAELLVERFRVKSFFGEPLNTEILPGHWRGQRLRPCTGKYANRGGRKVQRRKKNAGCRQ